MGQQTAAGGAIKNLEGEPHALGHWQEVPAELFRWRTVLSVPWKSSKDHINLCEGRAHDLAVRMRSRRPEMQRRRFLHLLDSQANLGATAKGRTGSHGMSRIQRRLASTLLATGLREVVGFTRSEKNPADRASRDKRGWGRHRRNVAIKVKKKVGASPVRRGAEGPPGPPP